MANAKNLFHPRGLRPDANPTHEDDWEFSSQAIRGANSGRISGTAHKVINNRFRSRYQLQARFSSGVGKANDLATDSG